MPKINDIFLKLDSFQYTKLPDLNMGYYYIRIIKSASNLCKIVLLCKKYHCKRLPMVVANSPNIFQQKINDLFHVFKFVREYTDDIFILRKGDWTFH